MLSNINMSIKNFIQKEKLIEKCKQKFMNKHSFKNPNII